MPTHSTTPIILTRFVKIVAVALATAGLTYTLRFLLIEPRHLHEQCVLQADSVLCAVRQTVIMGFVLDVYSIASIVLGLCALVLRSARCAWAAIVLGVIGALLYQIELAAIGLLLGVLAATRPPIAPQHRQGNP